MLELWKFTVTHIGVYVIDAKMKCIDHFYDCAKRWAVYNARNIRFTAHVGQHRECWNYSDE